MTLRALKTEEEIAGVPLDQPILIELPGGMEEPPKPEKETLDPDAKQLQEQLEAALAAQKAAGERETAERNAREKAEREAATARREAEDARQRQADLEGDVISGGLAAAQGERDAAKLAFKTAFEAGDPTAMAEAQSRIGRAEAKILTFESGAAEVAERKERKPVQQEQVLQQPRSFEENVRANTGLMSAEKDWLIKNKAAFDDPDFQRKLDSAYDGAVKNRIVRGSPEYFEHIELATGLRVADPQERETSVQAPVTPKERGADGRPTNGRITLSPEQREIAKSMGISEIEYAKQVAAFDAARRADPERYK